MLEFLTSQLSVQIATVIIFILTVGLTLVITLKYFKVKSPSLMFWSMGLWCFVIGVLIEIIFAFGYYSDFLIKLYFLIVAILVESLALGSMQFVQSKKKKNAYYIFVAVTTLALIYFLIPAQLTESNMLTTYVVTGTYPYVPLSVILISAFITFPAAIILVVIAWQSYQKTKNKKLLSIILGVIIVSTAGTLYIVQFPAFLYISEFIGILLLWYGFV